MFIAQLLCLCAMDAEQLFPKHTKFCPPCFAAALHVAGLLFPVLQSVNGPCGPCCGWLQCCILPIDEVSADQLQDPESVINLLLNSLVDCEQAHSPSSSRARSAWTTQGLMFQAPCGLGLALGMEASVTAPTASRWDRDHLVHPPSQC